MKELAEGKIEQARDLLILTVDVAIPKDFPMEKRLAVMRYMKTYIRAMADYEIDEFFKLRGDSKDDLPPDVAFKLKQASGGYDDWMVKRGRFSEVGKRKHNDSWKVKLFGDRA